MLNAGVFKFEWTTSSSGIESSLQVNHLSTALLALLLLPVLRKTAQESGHPARLTITSSEVHMWTSFEEQKAENILARLNDQQFFGDTMDRYSVSKLVNLMWLRELASRVQGKAVVINLVNPGSVDTGLHRDGNKIIQIFDRIVGRTPEEGGRLLIDAAVVKGEDTHGKYLSEAKVTKYGECQEYQNYANVCSACRLLFKARTVKIFRRSFGRRRGLCSTIMFHKVKWTSCSAVLASCHTRL
jgi:retinol dehydrogenase-12